MSQFNKYIGIPYVSHGRDMEGMDCLGLVLKIAKDELGIDLPDEATRYDDALLKNQVQKYINDYDGDSPTFVVTDGTIQKYDVLVFTVGGIECHIGMCIGGKEMIHLLQGCHSCIERYDSMKWSKRLAKVFRYEHF